MLRGSERTISGGGRLETQAAAQQQNRVKIKLGVERAFDVFCPAKSVLLLFKQQITQRQAFAADGVSKEFRLIGRHDLVLLALEQDDGYRHPVGKVNGRTFYVGSFFLGIFANEPVEVARLEFVGVPRQRFQVAHAVVARANLEESLAKNEAAERRIAPGAAAGDGHAL